MTDKSHMCLLGLILFSALLTGISGVDETHVFCSSGENVRLSCNNALSDCTSTTWIYNTHSETVELITLGIKKNNIERYERLSLDSNCSLNIEKVTKEDRGSYTCQQFVNGVKQGTDARVYLHVLHVSSSSSQSEIRSGRSVTLFCQLYYDPVSCDDFFRSEGIELIWVNQANMNLTDSRFQILSSGRCNISLTTTLLNEDHNREWRCQVTQRNQVKTSVTYTVKYSAPTETKTPSPVTRSTSTTAPPQPGLMDSTLIPVSRSNSEKKSSQTTSAAPTEQASTTAATQNQVTLNSPDRDKDPTATHGTTPAEPQVSLSVIGIVVAAVLAVLIAAVILWVVRKRRADNRKGTNDSVEQKDDVTYTEVATHCKIRAKKIEVHDEDKVTYSSIR